MNAIRNTPRESTDSWHKSLFSSAKTRGDPVQARIDCLIGLDTSLAGDVTFKGGLRVDGRIDGDVTVSSVNPGTLVVGEQGVIEGDVRVSHLIVYGRINGTVHASDLVDLRPGAHIQGDVHYGALEMQAGAVIEGYLLKNQQPGSVQ